MKIRRSARPLCLATWLLLVGSWLRPAAAQFLGPEFQVNTYTTGFQVRPAVAAGSSGGFVVVWSRNSFAGSSYDVFGQRFNSAGSKLGSEFQVNSHTAGSQYLPQVAADGSGKFVVVWQSADQDGSSWGVFGQRYNSAGSPVGSEFQVNTYTTSYQNYPAVAANTSGNFIVVWHSRDQAGSGLAVFGQRYSAAGDPIGSEFQVNADTVGSQFFPSVALDGSGNIVVIWANYYGDGSDQGVFGQRFDSTGIPVGGKFQVNTYTTSRQGDPAVAADGSGNFVVVWDSFYQDGSGDGVFGQRFNSAGAPVGGEFQINAYTTGQQRFPTVAADSTGNFVVAWSGARGGQVDVFGQRFSSAGNAVGGEFQVNTYTTNTQSYAAVAGDGSDNFVMVWESVQQNGIFGRRSTAGVATFLDVPLCEAASFVGGDCSEPNPHLRSWSVTSVLDHSGSYYQSDDVVKPFTTELTCTGGPPCLALAANGANGAPSGYRLDCEGTHVDFGNRLTYSGSGSGGIGLCPPGGLTDAASYLNYDGHSGYDFDTTFGDVILAAAGGTLEYPLTTPDPVVGGDPSRFNALRIRHSNGIESWYLHAIDGSECSLVGLCSAGQQIEVTTGQAIALAGNTGLGCGGCTAGSCPCDHLHIEVRFSSDPSEVTDPFGCDPSVTLADPARCRTGPLWIDRVFASSFEDGDACSWDVVVGGGC